MREAAELRLGRTPQGPRRPPPHRNHQERATGAEHWIETPEEGAGGTHPPRPILRLATLAQDGA
ncbi:MAG: hypothetical protein ACLF0P_16770, partial [Thermoanaerobaculia bacterium]